MLFKHIIKIRIDNGARKVLQLHYITYFLQVETCAPEIENLECISLECAIVEVSLECISLECIVMLRFARFHAG